MTATISDAFKRVRELVGVSSYGDSQLTLDASTRRLAACRAAGRLPTLQTCKKFGDSYQKIGDSYNSSSKLGVPDIKKTGTLYKMSESPSVLVEVFITLKS